MPKPIENLTGPDAVAFEAAIQPFVENILVEVGVAKSADLAGNAAENGTALLGVETGGTLAQYIAKKTLLSQYADRTGAADAGPGLLNAIAAAPYIYAYATPQKVVFVDPGEYSFNTEVTISTSVTLVTMGGVFKPNRGRTGGRVFNITAPYFRTEGIQWDGGSAQPANATGNTWVIRVNNASSIVEINGGKFYRCNATDGNIADTGAKNLLVTHAIYIDQADIVKVHGVNFDTISGTAVFANNCNECDTDNCIFNNVQWYNWNLAKGVRKSRIANSRFLCNHPNGVYWGGAVQTVNDFGNERCGHVTVENNYFTGLFSYGGVIRLQSVDGCTVRDNVFGPMDLGAWSFGTGTITCIRVLTRGGVSGISASEPSRNVVIENNRALSGCAGATQRHFIYLSNEWDGGSRNAASRFRIIGNMCRSPNVSNFFWTGLYMHGLDGGLENIEIDGNDFEVMTMSGGVGAIGFAANSSNGAIRNVIFGWNRLADIAAPASSFQIGIFIQAFVDNVRFKTKCRIENFFYGIRTSSGAGPTLEFLDDQDFSGCTTNTLFNAAALPSRYGKPLYGTVTYDPPSIAAGASTFTDVAVTGAALGDTVDVGFSLDGAGVIFRGYVRVANSIRVYLTNLTAGAVDLASGTLSVTVRKRGTT